MDLRGERRTAVVASRRVVFKHAGSIEIGSSNLIILTHDLVVEARNASDASLPHIFAFKPKDAPSNAGLKERETGRTGEAAGNVTIVVLGSIQGPGKLSVDLRGQKGGKGADGLQPPPNEAVGASAVNKAKELNWSFRKPTEAELIILQDNFAKELAAAKGNPDKTKKIQAYLTDFNQCVRSAAPCKFMLCDDQGWDPDGHDGPQGEKAGTGGKGGLSGASGKLSVYYLDAGSGQLISEIGSRLVWSDGNSIQNKQPRRERSEGGPPGEPGVGGPGGQGLPGDAVGACRAGKNGERGPSGEKVAGGEQGDEGEHGQAAIVDTGACGCGIARLPFSGCTSKFGSRFWQFLHRTGGIGLPALGPGRPSLSTPTGWRPPRSTSCLRS